MSRARAPATPKGKGIAAQGFIEDWTHRLLSLFCLGSLFPAFPILRLYNRDASDAFPGFSEHADNAKVVPIRPFRTQGIFASDKATGKPLPGLMPAVETTLKFDYYRIMDSALDGVFLDVHPVPVVGGFVEFGVDVPHYLKMLGIKQGSGIYLPVGIVPDHPFFPGGDVPDVQTVFPDQPFRVGGIGDSPF
jgi:hypothetical protein